jgi:maleylpyruvate isomerase
MAEGAMAGEVWLQYPGGPEQRAADIEAGAGRPAVDLVADVHESVRRLEAAWDAMTPRAWAGNGANADGRQWPCALMPFHRRREVEVHHVDLGLGYEATDWPDDYVASELPSALKQLPDRLRDAGDRAGLLAWLLGRADQPVLDVAPAWPRYYHDTSISQ